MNETKLIRNGATRWLTAVALCVGCNAVFGCEQPEHGDANGGGTSGAGSSDSSDSGNDASSSAHSGGTSGAGGSDSGNDAGSSAHSGGTGGGADSTAGDANQGGAPEPANPCGNGTVDAGEKCDDQNTESGDGCSGTCRIEAGFSCDQGEPTHCIAICGDGLMVGGEAQAGGCDDGNDKPGDGCDACQAEPGYSCDNSTLPSKCADVDECAVGGTNDCDAHAACTNTTGSFTCTCKSGYSGNGKSCANIDECAPGGGNNCSPNADCVDTDGSFTCTCKAGYSGTGSSCALASCVGLTNSCGASANDNCCVALPVTGGAFTMGTATAGTIATFALDKYEVTVGRFKNFANAYAGHPLNNAGAHPLIAGSGWQSPGWDSSIAADKATLTTAAQGEATYQTWKASGTNDFLPINCVTWYEAFAFCAWDGGRLPTEAEWEYAAKGGSANYTYPWGNSPALTNAQDSTAAYANYYGLGDGSDGDSYSFADILRVGSKPSGASKAYGQLDLLGSMWEWTLDWSNTLPGFCDNCASIASGSNRVYRGGGWDIGAAGLTSAYRSGSFPPTSRDHGLGFRCARTP